MPVPDSRRRLLPVLTATTLTGALWLSGCEQVPTSGPSAKTILENASASDGNVQWVQLLEVNEQTVARLSQQQRPFSEVLGHEPGFNPVIGSGDLLEISIWEAPPAVLFSASSLEPRTMNATAGVGLPAQMVDREGYIEVPFAGRLKAAGKTNAALSEDITQRLKTKAHQPQVLVRVAQNTSATVTVMGEVGVNQRIPLTAAGERLLDVLAMAGGVRQAVGKTMIQVTRMGELYAMPLDQIIRDPKQNIHLRPGDVVSAVFQTNSFISLGATGRQSEVAFEAQGITLAQALARAGGVQDMRADSRGAFIFRFEPKDAQTWTQEPALTTQDGRVPVVYRLDLSNPRSFFAMQSFPMRDKDILYVSNAPLAELQKFINLVFSINRQVIGTVQSLD